MIHMRAFNKFEERNLAYLTQRRIEYTLVQITETGFKKSILDATAPMRQYFKDCGMHDYALQAKGQENKVVLPSSIFDEASVYPTTTSLYRPETKNGDPRMWVANLKKHCEANDLLVVLYYEERVCVVNLSRTDIEKACKSVVVTPLKDLMDAVHAKAASVSNELLDMLRDAAQEWHATDILADTGVGRAIETLLGIEMNSSKLPDYKGIELKSYRDKRPGIRSTLFCQVPDWNNSRLKSAKEIVEKYGYLRANNSGELVKTYQNTVVCNALNSQNLGMTLYFDDKRLAVEEKSVAMVKVADVVQWQLAVLHQRLLEKHHETFWIEVETRKENGQELFRPTLVEYTKNPVVSQFDNLLDAGYISVDLLLSRPSGNGDTIAFKIKKQARPMLFPESEQIALR